MNGMGAFAAPGGSGAAAAQAAAALRDQARHGAREAAGATRAAPPCAHGAIRAAGSARASIAQEDPLARGRLVPGGDSVAAQTQALQRADGGRVLGLDIGQEPARPVLRFG
jgi:hypothetical protein